MKTLLLSFALLCIAVTTQAQFTTGQKMIGGQISGGYTTVSSIGGLETRTGVNLLFSASKFKSPTEYRSFGLRYTYDNSNYISNNNYTHGFGFFLDRTKLQQLAKRFYFTYTGRVGATYAFGKTNTPSSTPPVYESHNSYSADISGDIGLLYQLNDRFLFTCVMSNLVNVTYTYAENKYIAGTASAKNHTNSINLSTGLTSFPLTSLSIGVRYLLKK